METEIMSTMETSETEEEEELLVMDNSQVIKRRLKNLILSDKFCGLCYEESNELYSFNTELEIFGDFGFHEITVIDVIKQIFKKNASKVVQDIHARKICSSCLEQLNKCYLFISNMEYNYKVMNNYMDQLQTKIIEVDFIDNQDSIGIVLRHSEDMNNTESPDSRIKIECKSNFRCSRCSFEISNYDDLRLHERTHRWKAKLNCKICNELVYKQSHQEHLRIKHSACKSLAELEIKLEDTDLNAVKRRNKTRSKASDKLETHNCQLCFRDIDKDSFKTHKCHYSCKECDLYDCIHLKYLIELREQMHNNMKLTCPETDCGYSCKRRMQMIGHLNREHLDHHPFTCDTCEQQFFSKLALQRHIKIYHSPDYHCYYCDEDFSMDPSIYNNHVEICKETERDHPCRNCVAKFDSHQALENHLLRGCRKIPCPYCNRKFPEESKLSEHLSRVHNGLQRRGNLEILRKKNMVFEDESFPCEICGIVAPTRRKLRSHQVACHEEVICPECGKVCSKGAINGHLAIHRYSGESVTCEYCGKLSKNIYVHKRHLLWHTERITCNICSKQIPKGRIRGHIQYHIRKESALASDTFYKVNCSKCDFRTTNKDYLEGHYNQVHLKIRPYICEICNNAYGAQYELNRHMLAHTRAKEVVCKVCDAKLVNKSSLRRHMARHTGILPYKCDICDRAFAISNRLKEHKALKHSRTILLCPVNGCGSKFKHNRMMRMHVKSVHWPNKDQPFDVRKVKGLDKKYYSLFHDFRRLQID